MAHYTRPQRGTLTTDDGIDIAYYCAGDSRMPAVLFANGIGVDVAGATLQLGAFADAFFFISWEYRGVGSSPLDESLVAVVDLSMERQAKDARAVLDRLGVEQAVVIGWSMGVQVGLELARLAPERLGGLVALLGAAGRPFHGAFPAPAAAGLELAFRLGSRLPWLAQSLLDLAVGLPNVAFEVLSRAGFVGKDVARQIFDTNVRSVARVDKRVYLRTMLQLAAHDGSDVLPGLACPLMVIAGREDIITPPRVGREMAECAPQSEYHEVEGTHFALIENAEQVNRLLVDFVRRVSVKKKKVLEGC